MLLPILAQNAVVNQTPKENKKTKLSMGIAYKKNRITYLDGHRGLAILMVISFHAYVRWPGIVPYADQFSNIFILKTGGLGVQLFFLISGFVILMTLEKCSGFNEFIFRRWLRLFPAMLICSIFIFLTANYFIERPAGLPGYIDLIPGLTFIEPKWFSIISSIPLNGLEEAFWSLYVEVKFYVFAAFIYFWKGRNKLILALLIAWLFSLSINYLSQYFTNEYLHIAHKILNALSFKYFGWFSSGASFYVFHKTKKSQWLYLAIGISIASSIFVKDLNWQWATVAFTISSFFAFSVINKKIQHLLSRKLIVFFGFISYPLYLIHENMMIAIIAKMGKIDIGIPFFLYPLPPVLFLSAIAYIIASYGEVNTKIIILKLTKSIFKFIKNLHPYDLRLSRKKPLP